MNITQDKLSQEFDRQVSNLVQKGYPKLLNIDEQDFVHKILPLKDKLADLSLPDIDLSAGTLPFVIVVNTQMVAAEVMMKLVEKDGMNGVTILRPLTSNSFKTVDDVSIPQHDAYLLVDIDRGRDTINLPPNEAMVIIKSAGRSPLTINEGIALVTHCPEFLIKNNCFSLLVSRTGVDKRVPAIWINAKKEPNLGWCWDGNPHTWLGSASCGRRTA